ncbi:hypothetical protein BDV38DRAFT_295866 [Aspergillus pseudotamarii]|uniref:Methyltransferase n=1 Tax=Aspergillus pseudotamarii TaxID=132259 RepID=A0A5N6SGF0_ASPPS|nr:uncharacterized protein BDV38DRAFT_295866 [Aspergillus pseudotamarii]KAE8133788.1 hypothetical protein BDV38DRAFT_295866 [Aspergillus pseudotamarii]
MITSPSYIPRGSTSAEITFYVSPLNNSTSSNGVNYAEPPPPGQRAVRNYIELPYEVSLNDIRGIESHFDLDKDAVKAIQKVPSATTYNTFDSDVAIQQIYYPEVEALLRSQVPGAIKIVLFDHNVRRQKLGAEAATLPVIRAHIDQTPHAAAERVKLHVPDPEEQERLLQGRYRIINVWRPLGEGPVQSMPLAFASAASVDPADLVPFQRRFQTMRLKYNPNQKWWYWSGMTSDERLLLKCSDSKGLQDGCVAQYAPHAAFEDQRTPPGAKPRESIEVRALVFG